MEVCIINLINIMAYQYTNPLTGKTETAPSQQWFEQNKGLLFPGHSSYTGATGSTPVTAGGLTNEIPINPSNIQAPPSDSTNRAITDITNSASSYQKMIDQARQQQMKLLEQPTADVFGTQQQLMEQYGVGTNLANLQALAPEIADLNNKIAVLDAQEQQALAQYINANVSQGFSMGIEGRIKRQYASERAGLAGILGAKTAMASMYQGNIATAQSLINSTINALTYDITQQREDMDKLYDFYGDFISSLEKKEQIELANAREDLKLQEANAREDYKNKLDLILEASKYGIDVGIDLSNLDKISFNEMIQDISPKIAAAARIESTKTDQSASEYDKLLTYTECQGFGVPYGTTKGQVIEAGLIPKKPLPATQISKISDFENTIESWYAVKSLSEEIQNSIGPTKLLAYKGPISNLARQFSDPRIATLLSEVEKAFQLYRKETTGAQASDKELNMLRPNLPSLTDSPYVFFSKLNATIEGTKRAQNALLQTFKKAGYDVSDFLVEEETNLDDLNFTF